MFLRLTLCSLAASALLTGLTHGATPVRVGLSARGLPECDPFFGDPDAYVIVSYAYGVSEEFERVGTTSTFPNEINPKWTKFFDFVYVPGASQRLHFQVWDEDPIDANDYIGDVHISLDELSNAANGTLRKQIQPAGNGNLIISNLLSSTINTSPPQVKN